MTRAAHVPLEAMNVTLQHRGPDDRGLYWSADKRVGLAQCRLAVIDLSPAAHQPMSDASADVWITFNGEVYNFRELRERLEQCGHQFRSASDTEVVIEAYREWGDGCLQQMNGMFAMALYDVRKRRLLLARDRAGEKPLFYYHDQGRLMFGSELKALMADPAFPRRVDLRALDRYLAYGYVPGNMCIFEGAHKLRQGEALEYDLERDAVRTWRYWTLPEPARSNGASADDLEQELEWLLEGAVRRQLVADVPIGILLSGGVDSSLITAMAARVSARPVKTFTISFPGQGAADEAPYARLVAEHFGTDHTELAAEPATVELLPLLARQYDEPMADHSMVPTYLVSRLVRQQATVALGGDGGDELFGGYTHYQWLLREERLRHYVPAMLRRAAARVARALPAGIRGRNHIIGLGGETSDSIAQINVYFDAAMRRHLLRGFETPRGDGPETDRGNLVDERYTVIRRGTETDFRTTMVDAYLVKVDRASMLNSLEIRAPFLDYLMIEFAFGRVPDALKVTERERKILLRRVAAKILPPALDLKRKQGFTMPLDRWFAGQWGQTIADILRQSRTFDRETVDRLLTAQRRGLNHAHRLYALALFELWRSEYGVTV